MVWLKSRPMSNKKLPNIAKAVLSLWPKHFRHKLWKGAQMAKNRPIWSHWMSTTMPGRVTKWLYYFFNIWTLTRIKFAQLDKNYPKLVQCFPKYQISSPQMTKDFWNFTTGVKFRQMWSHWLARAYRCLPPTTSCPVDDVSMNFCLSKWTWPWIKKSFNGRSSFLGLGS